MNRRAIVVVVCLVLIAAFAAAVLFKPQPPAASKNGHHQRKVRCHSRTDRKPTGIGALPFAHIRTCRRTGDHR